MAMAGTRISVAVKPSKRPLSPPGRLQEDAPEHVKVLRLEKTSPLRGPSANDAVVPPLAQLGEGFLIDTVGVIGAPLVDGQNLEGADLAPEAMRAAGLELLTKKLGYKYQDWGDLDFAKRYDELGLTRRQRRSSFDDWKTWMETGSHESFSAWSKDNLADLCEDLNAEKDAKGDEEKGEAEDPYEQIVNAKLVGPALHLIYDRCLEVCKKGQFMLTIGGDHAIATPSIAAISTVHPELAVIWIDAHGDANTPEISPSMHYHGMPAAHLMGWFKRHPPGFEWMPSLKCVDSSRFAYIGLRDVDPAEGRLMRASGVHIFTMRDVDKHGIARVIETAVERVDPNSRRPIHLSLDVDSIDPCVAPGTGTRARGGLSFREIHYVCEELALTKRLVGMDLVEINPGLDSKPEPKLHGDDQTMPTTTPTVQLGIELVLSALGKTII